MNLVESSTPGYEETISHNGHRLTPQRREVYEVLRENRTHPTATEVFMLAKQRVPSISLATVYNCLETLVECGLAKQVNVDREATRYCANLQDHGHFVCERCDRVFDLPLALGKKPEQAVELPSGFTANHGEFTMRGVCAACNSSVAKN